MGVMRHFMKTLHSIKFNLLIFLSILNLSLVYAQKKPIIYSNSLSKTVKLSINKKVKYYESDSLILNQNNSFENYFKYSYFDEFGNSKTIGIYEIKGKKIILNIEKEFRVKANGEVYGNGIELNTSIICKKVNKLKIKCNKDYEVIRFLKKEN